MNDGARSGAQERVLVEIASSWEDWLTATLPSVLAALVAVIVVYLSGRVQRNSEDLQFRKNLRVDLYRRALGVAQEKLYAVSAFADDLTGLSDGRESTQALRNIQDRLRIIDAECSALASVSFATSLREVSALPAPDPGLDAVGLQEYSAHAEEMFERMSDIVRHEFGLLR